uniref:SecA family profile domain-containing protein n=1 Tax=Culex tarsalis TaxID=7177 RepID=A0A1Q3F2P3_CULTA
MTTRPGSRTNEDDEILLSILALFKPVEPETEPSHDSSDEDLGLPVHALLEDYEYGQPAGARGGVSNGTSCEDEILEALAGMFACGDSSDELELTVDYNILEVLAHLYAGADQESTPARAEVAQKTNDLTAVKRESPTFTRTLTDGIRFESSNGLEFVSLAPTLPLKVSQLKCSARIFHDGMQIRLHNEGCLMLIDDSFKAEVELTSVVPVLQAGNFAQATTAIFRQLRIGQIFVDKVMAKREHQRAKLLATIKRIQKRTATDPTEAMQLFSVVQRSTNSNYIDFCELLYCNKPTPPNLKEQAAKLHRIEETTERRNRFLTRFHVQFTNPTHDLKTTLKEFCTAVVENRTNSLLDMAPHCLREQLKDVPQRSIFRMHDNDLKVFHDLDQVLNREIFQKPLDDLAGRWINRVKALKRSDEIVAVVNPIYFSLCRSLEELIMEIVGKTDHNPEELLLSDRTGWNAMKTGIRWKTETSLTKCLQREYLFVVRLLKHFDPAVDNSKPFDYVPRRLPGEAARESMLSNLFRRLVGQPKQNPLRIPDELYVWYCLLDDVLHHVLPENNTHGLGIFDQILQNFVQLLTKATFEQMEMVRVITHSIGRFIVQIYLFVSSDKAQSYEDRQILKAQLDAINRTMMGAESTKFFRDLIDVFSSYWKNRCSIIEKIPSKNGLGEMEQIKKTLLAIVVVALRKNVGAEHVINLFRCLNDFIVDLDDVCFDWLIKSIPELAMNAMVELKLIEPMDNKWNNTENQVYHVIEPKKFQQMFHVLLDGASCPKHCTIEVVTTLLGCIHYQLERERWTNNEGLSALDQVVSSSALISSIRSTLIYLREQNEYVSFDLFLEERINPFCKLVENCPSLGDFVKRAGMIKESFCYVRKQNEMSIAEALRMYGELNDEGDYSAERLQQAYKLYSDQFEACMAKTVPEEDVKVNVGVLSKLVLESAQPVLFKEWSTEFKRKELPKILAGVAAVWATLVSADVSSTGKFFKPHCIQILCVLRLLGADSGEKGVSKHLAQVLTGQGKSLVLALIASVLALTGHQVQLVCYNDYLVERDAKDFAELYSILEIEDAVKYKTYRCMVEAMIAPVVDGKRMGLREFVSDLILSEPGNSRPEKPKAQIHQNSVLLMDEVDVFFTKEYYGTEYCPGAFPCVPGMDEIQEQIWMLVNNRGLHNVEQVTKQILEFIAAPSFKRKLDFNKLLHKETPYELVVDAEEKYVRQQFTNRSLIFDHLNQMINDAISVATDTSDHEDFRLDSEGRITHKTQERFVTWSIRRYKSVFNYFRLKQHNFKARIGSEQNYGYLTVSCGSLSYAMLPKAFPLILGVTGTLTSLNQYEKAAIERLYNINRSSIMPSFFGCSNLQYDPQANFTHLASKPLWMGKIFTQAHAAVGANRAVIIFFYNETQLEQFRAQYCGQLDRLQILTENTDEDKQEHLISEAGVAKTVTLATRGMGRGVDYKSSVAVEKNGGVHVIQSFFSLDVKEETQIRGRTARKDNRGSYELIVFDDHLEANELLEDGVSVKYAALDAARANGALQENKDIAESIERNEINHLTTMEYLASFFK